VDLIFDNAYDASYDGYEAIFAELAKKTFKHLHASTKVSFEVDFVDDPTIHGINRDYRHVDRPTDVISFAFDDAVKGEVAIKGGPTHDLGVIIISLDRALAQAKEFGHSPRREITFLFVHGLLHLMGYDHGTPEEEAAMFGLQDIILGKKENVE
jgi:probable rRNA maturation factor